ncbi:hypothetical protein AGRA3207_003678 [Actinomadura graeca]|uniref:Signal transduction histidine kinase n=1 Tax=Actinomadura graeca TaxID=2750812 RepID=A0ABX8R0W7_9ACTN|nr:ATP-binding protein [Actinomadura graeca]QXJ22643.1 hypothetical protein AGRA3207_003678 [Actinomadura graeca]
MAGLDLPARVSRLRLALDWDRVPEVPDRDEIVARYERHLNRMAAFVRAVMVPFLVIPLFAWNDLAHPSLAVAALAGAVVEATWYVRRVWDSEPMRGDTRLALVDVGFCVALMGVGSRAAEAGLRNVIMTEVVPFSLIASLTLAFAIGLTWRALGGIGLLWGSWCVALYPDVGLKLASDLLGFIMWYVVGLYVAYLLRSMAVRTVLAVATGRATELEAASKRRRDDLERLRDRFSRGLHDGSLGILDGLISDDRLPEETRELLRRASLAARAALDSDEDDQPFGEGLAEAADTYLRLGLLVQPTFFIDVEPPPDVASVLVAAAAEALNNAHKHAGPGAVVELFAEAREGEVVVEVVDDGVGFDHTAVRHGGGLDRTYPRVEKICGRHQILSAPGEGTAIRFEWSKESACPG